MAEDHVLQKNMEVSVKSANRYKSFKGPAIQINGRRVLGPIDDWVGPEPSNDCEIFIKKIPRHLNENEILPHFERFGQIYQFRLMMEFNELNRGYAFIRFTKEEHASTAIEVMNHFFILPGRCIKVLKSYDKFRLFVGNLPRNLSKEEIEESFREIFPKMTKVVMHNRISDGNRNRGFAFLDFPNHQEALVVKKQTTPGRMRKWGRDLKIVWANPERKIDPQTMSNIKTLFVRNIDLSVNAKDLLTILAPYLDKSEIRNIARVREFAFIDFYTRECAELALSLLQGIVLKGHSLYFTWALPPNEDSLHYLKNQDFDAVLRLKCIANYWRIPIFVFGRAFTEENIQYAAIMIQNQKRYHTLFFEISTIHLSDIQSRLCEVVVKLLDKYGSLPKYNFVIKINEERAYIVGCITDLATSTFVRAFNIATDLFLYFDELRDLSLILHQLTHFSCDDILLFYSNAIKNTNQDNYIENISVNDRVLGCVNPKYREKEPLPFNLDNRQIIFALCHKYSYTNYLFPNRQKILYNVMQMDNHYINQYNIKLTTLSLIPLHISQSDGSKLNCVVYGVFQAYRNNANTVAINPVNYWFQSDAQPHYVQSNY